LLTLIISSLIYNKKRLPPKFLSSKVDKQLYKTIAVYDRQTPVVVKCKRSDDQRGSYLYYTSIRHGPPIRPSQDIPATCREIREKRAWNVGEEKNKKTTISSHNAMSGRQKQCKCGGILYIYILYIFYTHYRLETGFSVATPLNA